MFTRQTKPQRDMNDSASRFPKFSNEFIASCEKLPGVSDSLAKILDHKSCMSASDTVLHLSRKFNRNPLSISSEAAFGCFTLARAFSIILHIFTAWMKSRFSFHRLNGSSDTVDIPFDTSRINVSTGFANSPNFKSMFITACSPFQNPLYIFKNCFLICIRIYKLQIL